MKKKFLNWIKRYWVIVWLVTVSVLLTVGVSLAAYTSFNSVKRVVSTGKVSDTLFGSNYLSLVGLGDDVYPTRQISPSETEDISTFTVQVCNYIYGNNTFWNAKDITYAFTVKVLSRSGGNLPEGVEAITVRKDDNQAQNNNNSESCTFTFSSPHTLAKDAANVNTYYITVPSALKDKIKLEIVAKPSNSESQSATNQQKLAETIILSTLEFTKNWTGHFLDSTAYVPGAYDAYNYEISGNGKGTVTLTWNCSLQISPWFISDMHITDVVKTENGNSCITFRVGEADSNGNPGPTAYQLQFYKSAGANLPAEWSGVESLVSVGFTPDSN